ncbi:MAG TPA: S-layer homology domain-containing protein [Clostridia bacterium]|nr:S-layer homology domain-containing protein [Clostridia bacterium]
MKKLLFLKIPIASLIIAFLIASNVYSENSVSAKNIYEKSLSDLGIIRSSYKPEAKVTRAEFITWVVRALSYDQDDASKLNISCKDVKKGYWAYDNIKIALNYSLVEMNPDKTIKPENLIMPKDALTILLKGIGSRTDLTKFSLKDLINESTAIGLYKDITLSDNKPLTHAEAYILLYNFLTVDFQS